jgi:hypothetical protein
MSSTKPQTLVRANTLTPLQNQVSSQTTLSQKPVLPPTPDSSQEQKTQSGEQKLDVTPKEEIKNQGLKEKPISAGDFRNLNKIINYIKNNPNMKNNFETNLIQLAQEQQPQKGGNRKPSKHPSKKHPSKRSSKKPSKQHPSKKPSQKKPTKKHSSKKSSKRGQYKKITVQSKKNTRRRASKKH